MIANAVVFVLTSFAAELVVELGLRPADLFGSLAIWQPVSYMFVHATLGHLFFNMLTLWFIGVELERMWGTVFFTKFYFICGLGAGFTQVLLGILPFAFADQFYYPSTVGASGAIYGLLLAFALYFPTRPFLVFLIFPVQAKVFVMILAGLALMFSLGGGGGVAHTAHLGGMVTAYFYLKGGRSGLMSEIRYRYLKWRIDRTRRKFDVYSGGRRDDYSGGRRDDINRRVH
jgi:membrane associated rhomboid family serine protease